MRHFRFPSLAMAAVHPPALFIAGRWFASVPQEQSLFRFLFPPLAFRYKPCIVSYDTGDNWQAKSPVADAKRG
jgi:hypothetical protein